MTALALTLMLSACGDDGKNAGLNRKTITASTNPAPTPTPTPTPTATARTYTYETAAAFRFDRRFIGYDRVSGSVADGKSASAEFSSSETAVTS
ncbi:hypothetical protein K7957_02615 [Sphingomonas yunnanensis]|uniref:hypothetical protein n=1 Tax=Sphingomonas yunnanensis TaxID=310400 RepID=UPI001CA61FF6|nr:hypothetical protein [Sphingomonas yunnanensis]MBY9061823.1 hypothetical protein [Sphingomonas yunnanensis]